jgi:hypothetical protein
MRRDEEIQRLIRYAQGMGLSVHFKPYKKGTWSAEWVNGTEITIFLKSRTSKIEKIMSLIHETAHHKAWINNERRLDPKVEEALMSEENKKSFRKRIFDMEVNDSKYWEQIYRDTNCTFPIYKLHVARDLDNWQYQIYYETGEFPTGAETYVKYGELKKKYAK